MYHGQIVFSQIMDQFPRRRFKSCVDRYRVKTFTCLDQFYCMTFAQLTGRESLRDIEACLRAAGPRQIGISWRTQTLASSTPTDGELISSRRPRRFPSCPSCFQARMNF